MERAGRGSWALLHTPSKTMRPSAPPFSSSHSTLASPFRICSTALRSESSGQARKTCLPPPLQLLV